MRSPGDGAMHGKVVVVTGGDMGIGKATATQLAAMGATVVITARPPADGTSASADIRAVSGNDDVHVVPLELGRFESIRETARQILDTWDRLDVLINNAGGFLTVRKETDDGHELSFGVNYLGPFLLTKLLLPGLRASAPARIVNVSSSQHKAAGAFDFDDLDMERSFDGVKAYNRSKLAVLLFTKQLAARLDGDGVTAYAVQPGAVRSNFGRHGDTTGVWALALKLLRPVMITPEKGAGASVFCASEPGIESQSGGYFQRRMQGNLGSVREVQPSAGALDSGAGERLWQISEALVGDLR